ncbi:MAG: hypothetical protein NT165_00300 [Candidatus Falkowbacteria bacterium]|nr:hypothetical protein [Candidatus Falkowbacteria bacterium]
MKSQTDKISPELKEKIQALINGYRTEVSSLLTKKPSLVQDGDQKKS